MSLGLIFLELRLPDRPLTLAGVILHDDLNQKVVVKMRDHWDGIAEPEDEEVLSQYEHGLNQLVGELGVEQFLKHIASNFANAVIASPEYRVNRPLGDLNEYAAQLVRQLQFDVRPEPECVLPQLKPEESVKAEVKVVGEVFGARP